jgi:hypothetical protein
VDLKGELAYMGQGSYMQFKREYGKVYCNLRQSMRESANYA